MITKGQARRIAADWQAPDNACSLLQHKGQIRADLLDELIDNIADIRRNRLGGRAHDLAVRELEALRLFAQRHGEGQVEGWGAWDETPVAA